MGFCVPSALPFHLIPYKIQPSPKPYIFYNPTNSKPRWGFFVCFYSSIVTPAAVAVAGVGGERKRIRHRKLNPGEKEGIAEELRFVAMKLRTTSTASSDVEEAADGGAASAAATWKPTMGGFINYLVDGKLVFDTLERIVGDSTDVTYVYFRKTGLERSAGLAKDLEWFRQQGYAIPQPSSAGADYAFYLEDLAEKSVPSFLCHFYNIYFGHIFGGCGIGKQVCEKLSVERKLEFYNWEGDAQLLLRNVRENLNKLGEHWPRSEKNKCLKEAAKSFKFSGQILWLIVLPKTRYFLDDN